MPEVLHPTILIAFGLAVLLAAAWWPAVPVVAAMAAIGLGATRHAHVLWHSLGGAAAAIHAMVYASLVLICAAGRVHGATLNGPPLGLCDALDFAAAAVLLWSILTSTMRQISSGTP